MPETLPHRLNKLTKTTPIRRENVQGRVVDKDVDGKSVPHGPTRTNVLEKKVDNNELANPQLDEEKNSCLVPDKLKGCRPKQFPTGIEDNVITGSDEESVDTELQDAISEENKSEEDSSDEQCDTDDDQCNTYDVKVINFKLLLTENIKHKIY